MEIAISIIVLFLIVSIPVYTIRVFMDYLTKKHSNKIAKKIVEEVLNELKKEI